MVPGTAAPSVSVVIPCFNQAKYLPAAVESVRAQLYQPIETIVVDDGSVDDTARVAAQLGVTLVSQPNRGVSEARNAGLAIASGDFIVFLDADDELLPHALAFGVAALQAAPHAAAVVGRCQPIDDTGRPLPSEHDDHDNANLYREWLTDNFVWTPGAAMFRRAALTSIGGFPEDLGAAADYAVYLRFARSGAVVYYARDLVRYRQHERNMSRDLPLMLRCTVEVLRRECRSAPASFKRDVRHAERVWRTKYGEQILETLRSDWRAKRWAWTQLPMVLALLRHCPAFLLRRVATKLRRRPGTAVLIGSAGGSNPYHSAGGGTPSDSNSRDRSIRPAVRDR